MKTLRFTLFLLLMFPAFGATARTNARLLRDSRINITLQRADLPTAIRTLRELTREGEDQVNFFITGEAEEIGRTVSLDLRGVSGADALTMILQQTGTRAEVRGNILWILPID